MTNPISALVVASILSMFQIITLARGQPLAEENAEPLDQYNVVWGTPSHDSSGSMPLGNGDIGLNVWVEEDGDLLFYIGKTDAWSENAGLLKLGRVRIHLSPNPFLKGMPFLQTQRLQQGEIAIRAGEPGSEISLNLWVDANQPVIHMEVAGKRDVEVQASLEFWRSREREIQSSQFSQKGNRIVWFHRNEKSAWSENMKVQGLESFMGQSSDPLMNRTFGGALQGDGLATESPATLKSIRPRKRFAISVYPLTKQTATVQEWLQQLDQSIAGIEAKDVKSAREAHRKWWKDFWHRSRIRVTGSEDAGRVSQGYALQRFMNACGGRGDYPIKFNGGTFTVDPRKRDANHQKYEDADYRDWGGPYWFQNTRLVYWPMLASGDIDLMVPLFGMYGKALPLAEARTQVFFGHQGAFFPETLRFWGTYENDAPFWDRGRKDLSHVEKGYITYYWQGGLELTAMMLDYYAHTQDISFAKDTLLPLAGAIVRFYDLHYPRDERGKLLLKPAQALETDWEAVNPLPEIAGLRVVLEGLLSLGPHLARPEQQTAWQRLYAQLPPLPAKLENGRTILLAAEELIGPPRNSENPELYAVFPYRLYGVGKPDLEGGRWTFEKRRFKGTGCWNQDAIQAAQLGLANVARDYTVENFSTFDRGSRFPGFWYKGRDWIPDLDHGGVAMTALQTMLLQTVGKKIFLFPAWPKEWDVEFKLHVPYGTTVEGIYRGGKLAHLKITPKGG